MIQIIHSTGSPLLPPELAISAPYYSTPPHLKGLRKSLKQVFSPVNRVHAEGAFLKNVRIVRMFGYLLGNDRTCELLLS